MNQTQNTPADSQQPNEDVANNNEENINRAADDYYEVDNPKKEVTTSIGDGEMHNEGLVGDGSVTSEGLMPNSIIDEQDSAELQDSQG